MRKNDATYWGEKKRNINFLYVERAKEFRKDLIKRATKEEKIFRSFLERKGIKYQFQKIVYIRDKDALIKKFYILDFYLPDYKLAVEIDGDYHNTKEQMELDAERESIIIKHYPNVSFLRIKNQDVTYKKLNNIIEDYISEL